MCGIFGWQFRPNYRPPFFKRALLAAALGRENLTRGRDSWGWYLMDTHEIAKGVGEMVGNTHHAAPQFCVLGHTRHGTVGEKDYNNSHPFEIGDVIGAHNGGIANHEAINKLRKDSGLKEYTCDSMHLIDAIDMGNDHAKELVGWGAVEWVHASEPKTVRLCRISKSGDLNVMQCQEGIIWSSTSYDLKKAAHEAGFKGILLQLEDNIVYTIHNGNIHWSKDRLDVCERGGYQSNFQSQWGGKDSYGSQGTLLDTAREEYKKKMKKNKGSPERGEKIAASNVELLDPGDILCTQCYEVCGDSGKCMKHPNATTIAVTG